MRGSCVEVNLLSSLLSALVNQTSGYAVAGVVPQIMGNRHPSIAPYETVMAADKPLVLAVGNDRQFRALCGVLGRPELGEDTRFVTNPQRVANREALAEALSLAFATRTADAWFGALTAAGVPCGPINDVAAAAIGLADSLGLAPVVDAGGVPTVADPLTMSATPVRYERRPPAVGADSAEILAWLGTGEPQ